MSYLNEKTEKYWSEFSIDTSDVEFLYNRLLELEIPQTIHELSIALISHRLDLADQRKKQREKGLVEYLPKETYQVNQTVVFPGLNYQTGKILSIRKGNNPEYPDFDVMEVQIGHEKRLFAARLPDHALNEPISSSESDRESVIREISENFGNEIETVLAGNLHENEDLIMIAGRWFPRSLLVHINAGHLNLAEALLEEANGGPLTTKMIIDQVELPKDVNPKLIDFSIDLALQEDGRFDEVGALGETQWYLKRLEPVEVQKPPLFLEYTNLPVNDQMVDQIVNNFEGNPCDEFEPGSDPEKNIQNTSVGLIFPHWRAGTLPLTNALSQLFPTSIETSRILFDFYDSDTNKSFPGWVVRPYKYVFGLSDWYQQNGLIPGSIVHLQKTENARKINIHVDKKKQNREWIKTVMIGSDNEVVFAILKQAINASVDERLAIFVPEFHSLDNLWSFSNKNKMTLEQFTIKIIRELTKLNPQGHVHAQELYAAINIWRRCAPKPLVQILCTHEKVKHVGDLYFRLEENS